MKRLYKEMALRQQRGYAESLYAVSMESLGFPIPQKIWYQAGLGDFQPVMDWLGSLGMQEAQNVAIEFESYRTFRYWYAMGCPVFSLDERTVDLFSCTEPPPPEEIKTPYAAFAVELPYATAWDGTIRKDGEPPPSTAEMYRTAIASRFGNNEKGHEDWHVVCKTTEDAKLPPGRVSISAGTSALETLLSNLCAYLASGGKKTKFSSKMRHKNPARKNNLPVKVWRIEPPLVTAIPVGVARQYFQAGETPPKTFRIGKRFMVRGHWRNQACGKNMQDRERKWIQPYLKGPEDGEAFSKVYKVGK